MNPKQRQKIIDRMLGGRRLKQSDVAKEREDLWRKQNRICPLCQKEITKDQAVLDHNHDSGHVRAVLHRQCNHAEGRILDWIKRTGKQNDPLEFLEALVAYWKEDYSKNPLHPTHKTEQEKEIAQLKKKLKTLKTDKGKQKYRDRIKELQEQLNENSSNT